MKKVLFFLFILFFAQFTKAQTIPVTNTVTIDASGSSDDDGTIVSYDWKQTSGTATTLTNITTAKLTVVFTIPGTYTYQVTVTDNDGGTGIASATVNVLKAANKPPHAVITISNIQIQLPQK